MVLATCCRFLRQDHALGLHSFVLPSLLDAWMITEIRCRGTCYLEGGLELIIESQLDIKHIKHPHDMTRLQMCPRKTFAETSKPQMVPVDINIVFEMFGFDPSEGGLTGCWNVRGG